MVENAIFNKVQLALLKDGRGTLRRISAFFIFRVEAVMASTLLMNGTSAFSIPLCPLTLTPIVPLSFQLKIET